ncbi:glycoside hydrolase family 55 protein [Niabella sp. CC-SYL272]|uniref:glycoside hydrolase family 55 protein n=1 Tax=Niabella agricola TaxID=2891571 RepID=UPI001F366B8B|nr:glycoside hydrolase family 55 protein [Niabella agricola]MCF3111255.1 glycoside hydrolase family 55 protein [Niabella agricola]
MTITSISVLETTAGTTANELCTLLGYYAPGDGGGGDFYWEPTNTSGDNRGTIIVVAGQGRWLRADTNLFNVKWFGAKGDASHDDTTAVQKCIDTAASGRIIYFPKGNYKITAQLNLKTGQTYTGEQGDYGIVDSPTPTILDFTSATGHIHCLSFDATIGATGPSIRNLTLNCGEALTGIRYYSTNYSNCYRPTLQNVDILLKEIADPAQACIWWDPVYLGTIDRCLLRGGRIGIKLIGCFMNRIINVTTQQGIYNNGNPPVAAIYTRQIRAGKTGSFIGGRNLIETSEPLIISPDVNSVMIDTDGGLVIRDTALEVNNGSNTGAAAKALIWMHKDGTQSPFRSDLLLERGTVFNTNASSGTNNGRAKYGILVEAGIFTRIVARGVAFKDNPIVITNAATTGLATSGTDFQRVDAQGSDFSAAAYTEYSGWKPATTYITGQRIQNGLNVYIVTTAGTSNTGIGPIGTGTNITDGTVVWDFEKENTGPFPLKRYRETNNDVYIVGDARGVKDNQFINANGSTERLGGAWGFFKATIDPGSISDNQSSLKLRYDNAPPYATPMKATVILRRLAAGTSAGRFTMQCSTNGGSNLLGRWDFSNIPLNEDRQYTVTGFAVPSSMPVADFSAWFRDNANQPLWDNIAVRSVRVEKALSYSNAVSISGDSTTATITAADFCSTDTTVISAANFLLPATAIISFGTPLVTAGPLTLDPGTPYITARTNTGFTVNLRTAPGAGNSITIPYTVIY